MLCPDTDFDCDNPGCRRGGCQGRRPDPQLARTRAESLATLPLFAPRLTGATARTAPAALDARNI